MRDALAIRLTRFFMKFTGFWISNDRRDKLVMDLAMAYTSVAFFIAWIITGTDLWYSRRNFDQGAYAACNAMTVLVILLKLVVFTIQRDAFIDLIRFSDKNFWKRDRGLFGQSVVQDCETRCVYFVCTFTFFAQCTVCSYMIHPIVENLGKNETDRILPFKIWLDFPLTRTPYFEILFFIETLSLIHSGICYFCFDNLLCIMIVYAAGQFRILQKRLEHIYDVSELDDRSEPSARISLKSNYDGFSMDESNHICRNVEFKDWVRSHQLIICFVKMVEKVYTFVILGQVLLFSLLICLVSYQAILADGTFSRRMIFIVHSSATFIQIFIFTLTCDDLIRQSESIAEAAYRARWHSSLSSPVSRRLAKDVMFVTMRTRRACSLTAGGFFPISLETFSTILSTSMSYLTLLRQGQDSSSSQ